MKRLFWIVIFCTIFMGIGFSATPDFTVDMVGQGVAAQETNTNPPAEPVKLIFIHHSSGENWLADYHGGLGLALRDNNYYVSDTNYGWGPDGVGDRTDIGYWWDWFRGPNRDTYLNALYAESEPFGDYYTQLTNDPGGENQIIMFKGCFPNSYLEGSPNDPATTGDNPLRGQESWSDVHTVANAKGIYNDLLEYFATRPDKLFIAVTAPPLMDGETDAAHAANARAFNNWLVNDWLADYPHNNVAVFDFYNVLTSNGGDIYANDTGAESGNHHRIWNGAVQHIQTLDNNMSAYPDGDSHPTPAGNQKATAEFVPLLNVYYNRWNPGHSAPVAPPEEAVEPTAVSEEGQEAEEESAEEIAPAEDTAPAAEEPVMIEDAVMQFLSPDESWTSSVDEQGSTIACTVDIETGHQDNGALQIAYNIVPNGWADCGYHFDAVQDWSGGQGLSFWVNAEKAGPATLMLFSGVQDSPTPFETVLEIPSGSVGNWAEVTLPWSRFERAHWADAGGLALDLTRMTGLGINFWADSETNEGVVWIDDLSLATGDLPEPAEIEEEIDAIEPTS